LTRTRLATHPAVTKDVLQNFRDLNLEVAARIDRNETVTAPGIPPDFPDVKALITNDCIQPPRF
jgi:hypothetical protein